MPNNQESHLITQPRISIDIASGLFTGVFLAGMFNPFDRALYLSQVNKRDFLLAENFTSPYHGFSQAIVQRAFQSGVYYIMQGQMKSSLYPVLRNMGFNEFFSQFSIGMSAGCLTGIFTNSISAVKYHTWGQEDRTFSSSACEMWRLGGYKVFFKGTTAMVGREVTFGATYEVTRSFARAALPDSTLNFKKTYFDFWCNCMAAGLAVMASGPLNYARNIQYATLPNVRAPTIFEVFQNIRHESKKFEQERFGKIRFFQRTFKIGWGTARTAVGMAIGQQVFDTTRSQLNTK